MKNKTLEYWSNKLIYDKDKGCFYWKNPSVNNKKLLGKVAGSNRDGYLAISCDDKKFLVHNLVWLFETGAWPEGIVDHRDLDTKNNRFSNLRLVTKSQNSRNRKPHGAVRYIGVWFSRGKFFAQVYHQGKKYSLGSFVTEEEAAEARDLKCLELDPVHYTLNFPRLRERIKELEK